MREQAWCGAALLTRKSNDLKKLQYDPVKLKESLFLPLGRESAYFCSMKIQMT